MECEIYAEVTVTGPVTQLETYMNWLSQTPECLYGVKRENLQHQIPLELTPKSIKPLSWRFASSNIKTKIKVATLRRRKQLNFTVNYAVLSDQKLENVLDFKQVYETEMYQQLISGFNPMPEAIKQQCEALAYTVKWGSYFIEDKLLVMNSSDTSWTVDYS